MPMPCGRCKECDGGRGVEFCTHMVRIYSDPPIPRPTRLTDAELERWDDEALGSRPSTHASRICALIVELKAERERCAELRRLVEVYGGLGVDRCGDCGQLGFHHDAWHQPDCAIAKALKETE
jgi:hypothetical protein